MMDIDFIANSYGVLQIKMEDGKCWLKMTDVPGDPDWERISFTLYFALRGEKARRERA